MARHGKTSVRTDHQPRSSRKSQGMAACRRAADLTRLAAPDGIMPVPWPDQRMRDLVKDGVADMIGLGMPDIVARQRDGATGIVALTGPAAGVIEFHSPVVKPVRAPWLSSCPCPACCFERWSLPPVAGEDSDRSRVAWCPIAFFYGVCAFP